MDQRTETWVDVALVLASAAALLGIVVIFAGCDWWNQASPVTQIVNVEQPCSTCPDGTTATAAATCECRPIVRNGLASSCVAEWTSGPTVCDWRGVRSSDGLTDSGQVQRGGEIDPGPPGQGGGLWVLEICGCVAGFDADS